MNRREYVLKMPLITEKSTHVKENLRTVAFKVLRDANKIEIKDAVEKIFKVKVQSVRI
jgi:large subunit ribosomal protein L23